ncbi:hypothetical protein NL431_28135, partial [Klebsiella pneumoniae]|nr:hypothetical protein [Klebsiella pneumoniae]
APQEIVKKIPGKIAKPLGWKFDIVAEDNSIIEWSPKINVKPIAKVEMISIAPNQGYTLPIAWSIGKTVEIM